MSKHGDDIGGVRDGSFGFCSWAPRVNFGLAALSRDNDLA